jgi:hypothetical protein
MIAVTEIPALRRAEMARDGIASKLASITDQHQLAKEAFVVAQDARVLSRVFGQKAEQFGDVCEELAEFWAGVGFKYSDLAFKLAGQILEVAA